MTEKLNRWAIMWALGCVESRLLASSINIMFDVIETAQVVDTGLQPQEEWQPVPKETPVFRNVPVANPADLVALKEERPPLPPIKRPVTPPPGPIQGGPTGFYMVKFIISGAG